MAASINNICRGRPHEKDLRSVTTLNPVMRRDPNCAAARSQTIRRRLGSVTLTGQGLGLGLGMSLFPVCAMEIKARISARNEIHQWRS